MQSLRDQIVDNIEARAATARAATGGVERLEDVLQRFFGDLFLGMQLVQFTKCNALDCDVAPIAIPIGVFTSWAKPATMRPSEAGMCVTIVATRYHNLNLNKTLIRRSGLKEDKPPVFKAALLAVRHERHPIT